MNRIIPELEGQGKCTLYIIGNGFDMYHDLKTRYHDFRDWLKNCHYDDFVCDMEKMFPALSDNEYLLWKDFEAALGEFKLLEIHRKFFQGKDDGFHDEDTYKMVVNRISPTLSDIPNLLRKWIDDIDELEAYRKLELSGESLFLSFNYTMLLENVYSIPPNQVLHIHNSIGCKDKLITGHNSSFSTSDAEKQCWGANEEQSVQLIAREMENLRKPVGKLITHHKHFFNSLQNISNVVVFGHSLSSIDRPYFTQIQRNIRDFAHWYFIAKNDDGITNCQNYVRQFNGRISAQGGLSTDISSCARISYRITGAIIEEDGLRKKMIPENCKYIKTCQSS